MWDYPPEIPCFKIGELLIDPDRWQVTLKGQAIHLTPKQFKLLWALAGAKGRILTRDWLIAHCWEDLPETHSPLEFALCQLRKKLGSEAWRIQTVVEVGIRMEDQ